MFKILDPKCTPTKGSKCSAAIDLYSNADICIGAGETARVPLGVCIDKDGLVNAIFRGYPGCDFENIAEIIEDFKRTNHLQLEPRSSLRVKGIQAGTGIIDLDYKDEIMIVLHTPLTFKSVLKMLISFGMWKSKFKILKGHKLAQILLVENKTYLLGYDTETSRTGGFGSTGK